MALKQRIESLKKRHIQIDALIQQEEAHASCDPSKLHDLKRQKLLLKDEISYLEHGEERQAA